QNIRCWRERLVLKIKLLNATLYYNLSRVVVYMYYLIINIPC
ncbi:hypothetical protein Kpol_177p1, partial [Vanderwaltozyma polyspora DSM 70294]